MRAFAMQNEGGISWEYQEPSPHYILSAPAARARERLKGPDRLALDEMVKLYRKAPNKPVAVTARQFALRCGVSRASAQRSILKLIEAGFLVLVSKGTYDAKRLPSRYRRTAFECNGRPATNDFIEDAKEWRRSGRRALSQVEKPTTKLVVSNVPLATAEAVLNAVNLAIEKCDA
jgi:predicted transcriptional regulator